MITPVPLGKAPSTCLVRLICRHDINAKEPVGSRDAVWRPLWAAVEEEQRGVYWLVLVSGKRH